MAIRLNVIMVHSPPANANANQLAESIVGEMIGRPGIDMTLVERLDHIAADSTDRLTLDSITGDAAVLDWRSPQDLMQILCSNGFDGVRAVHSGDRAAPAQSSGRKIYAFDLREFSAAEEVCGALMKLLSNRQIRTFSLGDVSGPKATSPSPTMNPTARSTTTRSVPRNDALKTQDSESDRPVDNRDPAQKSPLIDLDDLVDQLDALDP